MSWRAWALGVTAGLMLGLMFSAGAAGRQPGQIIATATLTANSIAQLPPRGRSGDLQRQRWRVTDRLGRTIGRMFFVCAWPVQRTRLCVVELQMPGGKITAGGTSTTALGGEYVVTGGTGRYGAGGGVMTFTAIGLRKQVLRVIITN